MTLFVLTVGEAVVWLRAIFIAASRDRGVFSFLNSWNNSLVALNDPDKVNPLVSGIAELFGFIYCIA